jgi:uncharacterized metal-binding protein
MSAEITKVGIICCSGEAIPEGTISRLATRRVLELLRPNATVTLCLPLFLAGNEGERNFAKTHPTITIDGCDKQCAKWGTEEHSGPVNSALVVADILGTQAAGCHRSSRHASQPEKEAVWAVAERIAAEVDGVLAEAEPRDGAAAPANGAQCSCSSPIPGAKLTIMGTAVTIPGLPLIFEQCVERNIPADATGCGALLDVVRVYHRILPEEEAVYRSALLAAYQEFRNGGKAAK